MRTWVREKVFHSGDHFYTDVEKAMLLAKNSIFIESYIFEFDEFGNRVIALLQRVAKKGVQVKLLVDGFGSLSWGQSDMDELSAMGIEVRIYNSLPQWTLRALLPWNWWKVFQWRDWAKLLSRLNRRNHRKVFLIDQKIAYIGSFNIAANHLEKYVGDRCWRDSGARVEGSAVKVLVLAFRKVWAISRQHQQSFTSYFRSSQLPFHSLVKLNTSRALRRQYHHEILKRIAHAKERVWITNPYFVPDLFFLRALRIAAKAHVDVRVLLPKKNDILLMKIANRAFYRVLLKGGVRVFEYLPRTLHSKVLLVDHWLTVGSSNRNHRSLIHDLEVDVVLTRPQSLRSIQEQFLEDLKQSEEIHLLRWNNRTWFHVWIEKLVLSFKNWL